MSTGTLFGGTTGAIARTDWRIARVAALACANKDKDIPPDTPLYTQRVWARNGHLFMAGRNVAGGVIIRLDWQGTDIPVSMACDAGQTLFPSLPGNQPLVARVTHHGLTIGACRGLAISDTIALHVANEHLQFDDVAHPPIWDGGVKTTVVDAHFLWHALASVATAYAQVAIRDGVLRISPVSRNTQRTAGIFRRKRFMRLVQAFIEADKSIHVLVADQGPDKPLMLAALGRPSVWVYVRSLADPAASGRDARYLGLG